jgi:Flp pilus assembly pilin Flp
MKARLRQLWTEEDGVLSFEWTLLVLLLVLGVVAGLAAARDAVIDELGDAAQAMLNLDNSYSIDWPLQLEVDVDGPGGAEAEVAGLASDSSFIDAFNYSDCDRASLSGQTPENVLDDPS